MTDINYIFKICLVGNGGVGKSTYVKRLCTGEFEKSYRPTHGVEVRPLVFSTNYGKVKLNIWDIAGQEKFQEHGSIYYIQSDAVVIMFDVTNWTSHATVREWYDDVTGVHGYEKIPVILCGNKVDVKDRKVLPKHINFHREKKLKYYDISVRSNYNLEKPFLELTRRLTGYKDLEFVEEPYWTPKRIDLDEELRRQV